MEQILVACGDVGLLKKILSELPTDRFKPIATKNGGGTAEKIADRELVAAVIYEQLADDGAEALLIELRQDHPEVPILLLTEGMPPSEGQFDNALRFPIPGPVLRNALGQLIDEKQSKPDKDRWRAFYKEVKARLATAPKKSYYGLLGVEDGAPHHELVTAFDRLSMRYHPDRYSQYCDQRWGQKLHDRVNSLYKLIAEAYGVLNNRRMRKKYDAALSEGQLRLDAEERNPAAQGPQSLDELAESHKARRFLRLAQTELAKGEVATAIQNLEFALSMEPENQAIQERLEKLKSQS